MGAGGKLLVDRVVHHPHLHEGALQVTATRYSQVLDQENEKVSGNGK